jgi:hypothetical protein
MNVRDRDLLNTSSKYAAIDGLYSLSFLFFPSQKTQWRRPTYGTYTSLGWWWDSFLDPVEDTYHSPIKVNCILDSTMLFMQECKDNMIP